MKKRLVVAAVIVAAVSVLVLTRTTGSKDDTLRIEETKSIPADAPAIGSLVTWDDYVAWVSIPDGSGKGGKVMIHDLEKKKTTTVAKGLNTGGPAWIRGSADTLVYLHFDHLACDDLPEDKKGAENCASQPRTWAMLSVDIPSGKKHEIAASKTAIDQRFPPLPEISWPYVVWTVPPVEISPKPVSRGIAVYDLKAKKGKVIVPGAIVGRSTIDEGTVVYTAAVPGADRWDLFAAKVNGKGKIERLTTSGKVIFPRTANGMVAWQEPSTTDSDQPAELAPWARPIDGKDRPVRLASKGSNPFPGGSFVIWISAPTEGGQLLAKDPRSKSEPIVIEQQPNFSAGWWAFGDRLAWVTTAQQDSKTTTTIHVARVVMK